MFFNYDLSIVDRFVQERWNDLEVSFSRDIDREGKELGGTKGSRRGWTISWRHVRVIDNPSATGERFEFPDDARDPLRVIM